MRTKHLLTAMMLPALFAACTNDDFESLSQTAPSVEGRAMVDNVTLNVLPSVGTRLAWDGDYSWGEGDEIGACLMDEIDQTNYGDEDALWHQRFKLVPYIQTNYKFTRGETAEWTTEAKMCEGNYFFVYPYNANKGSRDAYSFELGAQVLEGTDDASLKKAYTANNAFVGFGKVVAGDAESESVGVNMIPVLGGTGIVIENYTSGPVTIEKIVVKGTQVINEVTIDPTDCTQIKQYDGITPTTGDEQKFNVAQYTQDPEESILDEVNGYYNPKAQNYDAEAALADALTNGAGNKQIEVTLKGGITIQNTNSIRVLAMMVPYAPATPGTSLTAGDITVDIYTNKGIVKDVDLTKEDQQDINDDDVTVTGALRAIGDGKSVNVRLDVNALKQPDDATIGSTADLLNFIQWRANSQGIITANLASDLTLTKEVYDAFKTSKITGIVIDGASQYGVTIDAAATDGTLDAFTYTDVTKVTVNGTQSMTVAPAALVEVAAGATLNITKTVALAGNIDNKGTLNVKANVSAAGAARNINNEGTMTIAAGARTMSGTNDVFVNNSSTLTNAGTIDVIANAVKGTVTNTGVIGLTNASRGNNKGTITNDGEVYLSVNSGTIHANGQSSTLVNNNAEVDTNGTIVITNLDESRGNATVTGTKGYIAQEITAESSVEDIDSRANAVWLSAKLNIDVTNADGDYEPVNKSGLTVIATGADAEIYGHDQRFRIEALGVNAGASLYLTHVTVVLNEEEVAMNGMPGNPATLQVNSNASLTADSGDPTVANDGVVNIYKNFGK